MAILFCRAQVISRADGRSAVAAAAYRSGAELVDERTGQTHDYRRKTGVLASGILAPDHAPAWVQDREQLWNRVEAKEDTSTRRKEAQLARELMIAMPHELDDQHREYLLKNILRHATRQGMVADYSIHAPGQEGDERNHHAHVMLTMRKLTPDGFGAKERAWNERTELKEWKRVIEHETNRMMERCGFEQRVTVELEEGQRPTRHLGPAVTALERQGVETELGDRNREAQETNRKRREAVQLAAEIEAEAHRQHEQQADLAHSMERLNQRHAQGGASSTYSMDEVQGPTVAFWQADRGQEQIASEDSQRQHSGTAKGRAGEASTTLAPDFTTSAEPARERSPRYYATENLRLKAWEAAAEGRIERMKQRHTRAYDRQQRGFDEAAKLEQGAAVKSFNDQQREAQTRALKETQAAELAAEIQRQQERREKRDAWAAKQLWTEYREDLQTALDGQHKERQRRAGGFKTHLRVEWTRQRQQPAHVGATNDNTERHPSLERHGDASHAFNPLARADNDNRPPDAERLPASPAQVKQEAERLKAEKIRRAQALYREWADGGRSNDGGREFKP